MSDSELMGVDVNLDHGVSGGAEPVPHRRAGRGLGRVAGWASRRDGRGAAGNAAGNGAEIAVSGADAPTVADEPGSGDPAADGSAGRAAALRRLTSDLSAAPRPVSEAPAVDDLDVVTLLDDPFREDDLASELRSRAPLPITRTTVMLAGLVLVVAGFLGGVLVEKNFGITGSSGATGGNGFPAALASRGAGGGFGNAGGGGGAGANAGNGTGGTGTGTGTGRGTTTGTVTLVDGTTVYVTTANGDVVIIKTTGTTTVRADQTIPLKDLPVGASVTVTGTTGADGSVTATQITQAKK